MKKKPTPPTAPDPLALAQADLDRALSLVDEAVGLIRKHAVPLTPDMRATSAGKLRAGEAGVLTEILEAADGNPHLTAAHGDSDGGVDPDRFETELLRQWLAQHRAFAHTLTALEPKVAALQSLLSDTAMHFGATRIRLGMPCGSLGV